MRANKEKQEQELEKLRQTIGACGPLRENSDENQILRSKRLLRNSGSREKPQLERQQPHNCAIQTTNNKLQKQDFLQSMYKITTLQLRQHRCTSAHSCQRSRLVVRSPLSSPMRLVAIVLVSAALLLLLLVLAPSPSQAFYWSSAPSDSSASAASSDSPNSSAPSLASSLLSAIQDGASKVGVNNQHSGENKPILSTIQEAVSAAVASAAAPSAAPSASVSAAPAAPAASAQTAASSPPASGSASSSSIVASLSSAVASAAAAAAVAAAQNTLSGGDARSLLTSNSQAGQSQANNQQRRGQNAVHLAMKLAADAMPEVPYNILHNMKKLDHAAPFYNVGAKTNNPGLQFMKEGGGLLANALSASPSAGSGATGNIGRFEQLSSFLRSPLWKRLADGYGEFTSEFRSLFRVPPKASAGTSAAVASTASSSSSTGRLLRDISVPAILMLLASTIPSEQWRPVRTRRKSFPLPTLELSPAAVTVDPMTASETSLSALPLFSVAPNLGYQQQPVAQPYQQQQLEQQLAAINQQQQLHRSGDINLQQSAVAANWLRPYSLDRGQQQQQHQNEEQSIRRVGDSFSSSKPVAAAAQHQLPPEQATSGASVQHTSSGLLGSLTSSLVGGGNKLMNKIMNANSDNQLRVGDNLLAGERHKYSLVPSSSPSQIPEELQAQQVQHKHSRHLLSAMNQAFSHMLAARNGEGSGLVNSLAELQPMLPLMGGNVPTIYHLKTSDSLLRRNQQPVPVLSQEQRELSQFIPQSWRDVVKRTVSSVQQQASTQWRSIEGQLTNWVQDKLKTLPGAQSTPSASTSNASAAPVANIIASVSSTAMNMLGLGGGGASAGGSKSSSSLAPTAVATELQPTLELVNNKNKSQEVAKPAANKPPANAGQGPKAALAGVANLIVNTLTNRSPTSSASSSPAKATPTSNTNKSESSRASQYPTLTGAQPSSSISSSSSIAPSATSTTQAVDYQSSSTSSGTSSSSSSSNS